MKNYGKLHAKKVMRAQISSFQITHLHLSRLSSGTLPALNPTMRSISATSYFFYSKHLTDFLQCLQQASNKHCATQHEKMKAYSYYLFRDLTRLLTNLAALTFEISEGSISVSALCFSA